MNDKKIPGRKNGWEKIKKGTNAARKYMWLEWLILGLVK